MKMIKVKSSNIESIGYSENLFHLVVEFKATDRSPAKTFVYEDVSPGEYEALMNAGSVGKHFSAYIKAVKEGREIGCDVIDGELHARDLIVDKGKPAKENNGWISVDDRLPKIGQRVIIWTTQPLEAVMYETRKFNRFGADIDYATHWMPLPEPPTTQKQPT